MPDRLLSLTILHEAQSFEKSDGAIEYTHDDENLNNNKNGLVHADSGLLGARL